MSEPLYKTISDELLKQIHTGKLCPGDRLLSERQLRRKFHASDTTIRRALEILRSGGYIWKKHGSGNYVMDSVSVGGSESRPELVIACYGQFGHHVGVGSLLENLSSRFDNVKTIAFDTSVINGSQINNLLKDYNCPVILLNSKNQTAEMAEQGILYPLEEIPELTQVLDRIPNNRKWRFSGIDGKKRYYGMPYLYISSSLGINRTLAEEVGLDPDNPPRNWTELLHWCQCFNEWKKTYSDKNVYPFYTTYNKFTGSSGRSLLFMASNGSFFDLDESDLRRALQEYLSFTSKLFLNEYVDFVGIQSPDPFVSGKYLFSLEGRSWVPRDIERYRPDLKTTMVPIPPPSQGRPRFSAGGTSLISIAIPPNNKYDFSLMREVLQAMLEPEWYADLTYNLGGGPADPPVYRKLLESHPELTPFYDAIFTTIEPYCPNDGILIKLLDEIVVKQINNPEVSVQKLIDKYVELYNKCMGEELELTSKEALCF